MSSDPKIPITDVMSGKPFYFSSLSLCFLIFKIGTIGNFSHSLVIKTWPSNEGGAGLISAWETKMPHASWPKNQNIKQKQSCNKFSKHFKNGPRQKKKKIYNKKEKKETNNSV